jgi:hypothetical protein
MDTTRAILIAELEKYAGKAFNGYTYLTANAEQTHFVITSVATIRGQRVVNTAIITHILGERIIIDRDIFDKSLAEALLQAGIPRGQIILAYMGEPVPASA